jgi:hypothetical protein
VVKAAAAQIVGPQIFPAIAAVRVVRVVKAVPRPRAVSTATAVAGETAEWAATAPMPVLTAKAALPAELAAMPERAEPREPGPVRWAASVTLGQAATAATAVTAGMEPARPCHLLVKRDPPDHPAVPAVVADPQGSAAPTAMVEMAEMAAPGETAATESRCRGAPEVPAAMGVQQEMAELPVTVLGQLGHRGCQVLEVMEEPAATVQAVMSVPMEQQTPLVALA